MREFGRPFTRQVAGFVLVLALIHCALLAWRSRAMPYLGSLHDDSVYWVTAKSLAEGKGYRVLSFPGQPYQTKFPPVYPILLSLAWRFWPNYPQNLVPALAINFLIFVVLVFALRSLYRLFGLSEPQALLVCAIFALDPYVNVLATSLMSELLFLLLMVGSMLLAEAASRRPDSRLAFSSGILAGVACLTRIAGLPVLVSTPLVFALQRRYRHAVVFAAGLLPWILGWNIWTRMHKQHPADFVDLYYLDYLGEYRHFFSLRDLAAIAFTNSTRLWNGFATLLGVALAPWFSALIGLIAIAGTVLLIRSSGRLYYAAFALGYVVEMLWWPYVGIEGRLAAPVFPLLLVGLWKAFSVALQFALTMLTSKAIWKSIPALGIILAEFSIAFIWLVSTAGGLNALRSRAASSTVLQSDAIAAYTWIKLHTPPDSIVIAKRDCVLYLNTGRASFFPFLSPRLSYWPGAPPFGEYSSVAEIARGRGARYAFVSDADSDGESRFLIFGREELDRRVYRQVFHNGSAWVYEIFEQ